MSKHTPGPWAIYMPEEGYECPGIEAAGVSIIVFAPELLPGEDGGVQGRTVEEAAANARLIAAAPQLLEALQAYDRLSLVIESAVRLGDPLHGPGVVAAIKAGRAAIATATQDTGAAS